MITANWVLVARGATIDRDSNQMSIFGVVGDLNAEGFPLLLGDIAVCASFRREASDPSEYKIDLKCRYDSKLLFSGSALVNFQDKFANNLVVSIKGVIVHGPGKMEFAFYDKARRIGVANFISNGPAITETSQTVSDAAATTVKTVAKKSTKRKTVKAAPKSKRSKRT